MRILNDEIKLTCDKCEVKLAVSKGDVHLAKASNRLYCTCPCCYSRIFVWNYQTPKHWEEH